ncbi:AraC family transcriptional regulator [Spirosoma endophyticum]|uniref:AraC-type DNA-binding protein n=1 Tax=Spirosoma endophyticum TaxID=662367 RepID=A0A1I1Z710_9BACT|nr:AraC family transcriptional regulator [Spirosoma endophyticum]SFE27654.1 AraC-type DNA-binding protein [Spirosoma endophyticum]
MNQLKQLPIDSLYQYEPGSEQLLAPCFGQRRGEVRLFRGEQFTVIDTRFLAQPGSARWSHYNQRPLVELNFVLGGYLAQTHSGLLQRQAYVTGYHNCLFNPDSMEENELACDKAFQMLSIQLEPGEMMRLLMAYAPELETVAHKLAKRTPFVCQSPILDLPEPIKYALRTIWQSPSSPGLKQLHFDSVILRLLGYQFAQLLGTEQALAPAVLRRRETDKLYYARDLLLEQLSAPPRLSELAKACELNEFSLKKGFKELFGTPVFGFVLQQRMAAARIALTSGEKNISELAYELGYAHPQHFTRVFKKYTGVTPKTLKKS